MPDAPPSAPLLVRLAPLCAAMFFGFLSVSLPLPVLALHVHGTLGYSVAIAGLAVGLQSFATILTRAPAGRMVDKRGVKPTLQRGLLLCSASGLASLGSAALSASPGLSFAVLLMARLALGVGESLLITGVLGWALVRAGPGRAGRAMAWNGVAQYGALALGGPIGFAAYGAGGFGGVAVAATAAPLIAYAVVWPLQGPPPVGGERLPLLSVLGRIWRPGVALALAGVGFSAISTFAALDYQAQGWPGAGYALLTFGTCFIAVRLFASGWADRIDGRRLAAASMTVACLGQTALWLAPHPAAALLGGGLTGCGCSLVFPALGVLAFDRVPAQARGIAVGAFAAFQDLAIGATGPVLGTLASLAGIPAVFAFGALAAASGALVSLAVPAGARVPPPA